MKKLNNKGFILAETLIVSVFLMVIFGMLYSNFYPIIGEYEKRENYDDVDGKYAAYWIKQMIESDDFTLHDGDIWMLNNLGYFRFDCSQMNSENGSQLMCENLLKSLEISRSDLGIAWSDVYVTRYQIGWTTGSPSSKFVFKDSVRGENNTIITNRLNGGTFSPAPINNLNHLSYINELPRQLSGLRDGNDHLYQINLDDFSDIQELTEKAIHGSFWERIEASMEIASISLVLAPATYFYSNIYDCLDSEYVLRAYGDTSNMMVDGDSYNKMLDHKIDSSELCKPVSGSVLSSNENKAAKYCLDNYYNAILSPTKDYILSLPNYSNSVNKSHAERFRVIIARHHTKHLKADDDIQKEGYYSFATMEVDR